LIGRFETDTNDAAGRKWVMSFAKLQAACKTAPPAAAVVLGSGMGAVAGRVRQAFCLPFADMPGMPAASVTGHRGVVTLGDWAGVRVLVFEGRLHFYEGHAWEVVTLPVRLAATLGASMVVLTNAAGGIAEGLNPGDLMAVRDHVEWTRPYTWRTPEPGCVVTLRRSPYSSPLRALLAEAAKAANVSLQQGIYAAVTGPCYETPAEIRALRTCGADAVGMSTAAEAQAAADAGMEVAAVSLIANRAAGLTASPLTHAEVLAAAGSGGERLADVVESFLKMAAWGKPGSDRQPDANKR
jgi:purine-nucleoside phosphorylase